MNKTKILLITLVIIIIGTFVLYGVRSTVKKESVEQQIEQVSATTTVYFSDSGEQQAQVTYKSDTTALLTLSNTEYQNTPFTIATSASGARYENTEQGLVLWEKAPQLTIYKNDEPIFEGSNEQNKDFKKELVGSKWIWYETIIGEVSNSNSKRVSPEQEGKFSLTFTEDGQVNGVTDCNNFGGTYTIEKNKIKFGSFMSTLMYCEGSKEQDFISMIQDGTIETNPYSFDLVTASSTVFFSKAQ
jgi:heat shock protein HslJ